MSALLKRAEDARSTGEARRRPTCCVVLPAYNEGDRVARVAAGIPSWVEGIIIVDDASTDDTFPVATSITDPRVRVERHEVNRGVGGAMVTGYQVALTQGFDVIVKMDADDQMDPAELADLVAPVVKGVADYVKGNRFRVTGRPPGMPRLRWLGSVTLSFLTKVASGYWHVFDPQCGFTAISAPTLARLKLNGIATDYFFENDMLIRLNVIDARVVDVSTTAHYRDERSGLRIGHVTWTFPFRLARGFAWRFVKRHVVNDFGLIAMLTFLGGILFLFGVVFGAWHWVESAVTGKPATAGTVMVAVLPIILGFQMLLQALTQEVQSSPGAVETREYARRENSVTGDPKGG